MKIKYCGSAKDYSGYGEASRHDIAALVGAGVEVTTEIPKYTLELSDFGPLGAIATEREGLPLGYRVKILHTTPNVYRQYMEVGKYHIGRVFWETNKLPLAFSTNVQMMDEIWTGSQYNADAIKNAGVTKPIYIIPEAIDTDISEDIKPYITANETDYRFYSIFEWTERKNPGALLEAFWLEFKDTKNVSLTIKTYIDNFNPEKKNELKKYIKKIKRRLNLNIYAPVYIYSKLMERRQIYRFHKSFDCFVSAHRGEGWGIPQMEALLMSRPIISTNCGGIHEYLIDKQNAILIPYKHSGVANNRNTQWYTPDQKWADVDIEELRKAMRWVFENRDKAKEMGEKGSGCVKSKFSLEAVGKLIRERLTEIQKEIGTKL